MVRDSFWGLEVNSISIINMIMAVGLVVDYSAHVIHNFGLQHQATSRDEAVAAMLLEIGPPVFLGGLTTFLGIAPLAASNSTIFRTFFKMFLGIILYGLGHGLILMPVVLSLFGVVGDGTSRTEDQQQVQVGAADAKDDGGEKEEGAAKDESA
jgi:predicted RND superfamily exporter protein